MYLRHVCIEGMSRSRSRHVQMRTFQVLSTGFIPVMRSQVLQRGAAGAGVLRSKGPAAGRAGRDRGHCPHLMKGIQRWRQIGGTGDSQLHWNLVVKAIILAGHCKEQTSFGDPTFPNEML